MTGKMFVRIDLQSNMLSLSLAAAKALGLAKEKRMYRTDVFYNKQTLKIAVVPSQTGRFTIRYNHGQHRMYIGHLIRMLPAFNADRRYECEIHGNGMTFTLERRRKNG